MCTISSKLNRKNVLSCILLFAALCYCPRSSFGQGNKIGAAGVERRGTPVTRILGLAPAQFIGSKETRVAGPTGVHSGLLLAGLQDAGTIKGRSSHIAAEPLAVVNSSWNGGTGTWNTPSDWTPAGVPNNSGGTTYDVTIDSGGTDAVTLNMQAAISSLVLGGTTGSSSLTNLSGNAETLEVTGATTINSTGSLAFGNASTLKFDGGLTVGGTFSITGATATVGTTTANANWTLNGGSAAGIAG
jgi:hypothetical protein